MSDELPPRPQLTITVGDREIKMSYGLEMDLRRMLPDPGATLLLIQTDPTTQDYLVRRVLTEKKGQVTNLDELIPDEDVDVSSDDVENILSWVAEHSLYFFVKRASEMAKLAGTYKLVQPKPSSDGSEDSVLTTPFAGPSAASKVTSETSTGPTPGES